MEISQGFSIKKKKELQFSRVPRHTSSQGESFRSFWDAATYDKLYLIVKQSCVLFCCWQRKKSFSVGVPTAPTPRRSCNSVSLFGFSLQLASVFASPCGVVWGASYYVSFSCMCIYNNDRSPELMFSFFISRKRISVFMCLLSAPHRAHFTLLIGSELWQEIFFAFSCFSATLRSSGMKINFDRKLDGNRTTKRYFYIFTVALW